MRVAVGDVLTPTLRVALDVAATYEDEELDGEAFGIWSDGVIARADRGVPTAHRAYRRSWADANREYDDATKAWRIDPVLKQAAWDRRACYHGFSVLVASPLLNTPPWSSAWGPRPRPRPRLHRS